ncbi:PDC sensor domain-containing protein [Sideroxydans sp.]
MMNPQLNESIERQRKILKGWLSSSLSILAEDCMQVWPQREALEARLLQGMSELPYCKYLYLLDPKAKQITSNIYRGGLMERQFGRDRSHRPYIAEALAGSDFSLSDAYISQNVKRPSLTAVQVVRGEQGELLGYLGADFDMRELPATQALYSQPGQWMQLKGDPAIRGGLFHQQRVESLMDQQIETVLHIINELITIHGVFHAELHFSSSRATIWEMSDRFRFRLHGIDELGRPDLCLAYPRVDYPADAEIPAEAVHSILNGFRDLRFMDETIYLRSGRLNIFNGMIGLTFSCDGTHYMPWQEFLDKKLDFLTGAATEPKVC